MRLFRRSVSLVLLSCSAVATACVHAFWRTDPVALHRDAKPVDVATPVKVHLVDGTTIVFRHGARIGTTRVEGDGEAFGVNQTGTSTAIAQRAAVPFDSIVGVETFQPKLLAGQTVAVSVAATAVTAVGTVALLKAIFGSCPTVYADTGASASLQAEGFSYAIAPLLEQRDLDPLTVAPDRDGTIRLELRNEALETHYINNLELVAVSHRDGALALPDQSNRVVVVDDVRPLHSARDRAGRDVLPELSAADGRLFASASSTVRAAHIGDLDDWIDLDADDLAPGDSLAVVLRLRNSLLNTVLLYDGMLGGRDAPEWLDAGLERISTAVDLSRWYARTMGMRATVAGVAPRSDAEPWTSRMGDAGPLAFRDVAIVLPRPAPNARRVHVRLSFVADNWRIDRAMIASRIERPTHTTLPLARVLVHAARNDTHDDTAAVAALREPDGRYLETLPGQRMRLEFQAPHRDAPGERTTYLIAWQGWYSEWVRGAWLASPSRTDAWQPGDAAMLTALQRWQSRQPELERAFYATRIPVR
jgi:hypothetical protein